MPPSEGPPAPARRVCLDDAETLAFVDGTCGQAEHAVLLAHVDHCPACRELIAGLLDAQREDDPGQRTASERPAGARSPLRAAERAEPAERPSMPAPQTLELQGPYRVLGLLAEGGMGRIYRARDTELDREVAIKVPRSRRPALLQRFEREVTITARLQHPGVVPIHGAGTLLDGTPFYVMRFIDGTPLDMLLARATDGAARLALVERVVEVAETMAYVHARSIAHRDLKPNNILISQFDETLIIDWGLAKEVAVASAASLHQSTADLEPADTVSHDATPEATAALTRVGDVLGTPAFMSPEQAAGRATDQRADVYALGGILFLVITGDLPTAAPTRRHDAPPALVEVWTRAMAPDPRDRYAEAGAFAKALRAALAPPVARPARPRRARWWLGGIALVAAALVTVGWWRLRVSAPPGRPAATLAILGRAPSQVRSLAVSPSGSRLAYANFERIEVRDLSTGTTWGRFAWTSSPSVVEFNTEDVVTYVAAGERGRAVALTHWNIASDEVTDVRPMTSMHWLGSLATGELLADEWAFRKLELETAAGRLGVPLVGLGGVTIAAVAPSRRAFAFIDAKNKHVGVVRAVDDQGREFARSPEIADLTGLAWLDEHTLLYTTGSQGYSRVYRAIATTEGLVHAVSVFEDPERDRWISSLATGGMRIAGIVTRAVSETRILASASAASTSLDPIAASALLAWEDEDSFYTWNRNSEAIELRHTDERALPTSTGSKLHGDPVNATRAGTTLIGALRATGGRRIEAVTIGERTPRWTREPGVLELVRCAGDRTEPCVAGVTTKTGATELRRIDPATGTLGDRLVDGGDIADAALDADGRRLAWLDGNVLYIRELATAAPPIKLAQLSSPRSVAFDRDGAVLASFSGGDEREIRRYRDDTMSVVVSTPATTLSLIRTSTAGTISYRTRVYESSLAELSLPR